jgi:hypothetical protein
MQPILPVDVGEFPSDDPFLPWLHDYFTNRDVTEVVFVAQNRRRCQTGERKDGMMKLMEPQVALFQGIPVKVLEGDGRNRRYRLASPSEATTNETRFLCHFHDDRGNSETTLSAFPFNYEYVMWRKGRLPMYKERGSDVSKFELSQLLFSCPLPSRFRASLQTQPGQQQSTSLHLDLVPIRTLPRRDQLLLTDTHVGVEYYKMIRVKSLFNATEHFGRDHILPSIEDSGRWANLPVCPSSEELPAVGKPYRFVVCTWTSAMRQGDATPVSDSAARLQEWIVFQKLAGVDHAYISDNTLVEAGQSSPLEEIAALFTDFVTYHPWPASVCSNNRPNFKNPGERSSQGWVQGQVRSINGMDERTSI